MPEGRISPADVPADDAALPIEHVSADALAVIGPGEPMSVPSPALAFDYAGLTADVVRGLRATARKIRAREGDARRAILDIGRMLVEAKATLPHGRFMPWVSAEVGISHAAANKYLAVVTRLPPKFLTVTNLPLVTLYALAAPSTPADVREEAVAEVQAGKSLDPEIVQDRIMRARERMKPDGKRPTARARRALELAQQQERQDRQQAEQAAAAAEAVAILGTLPVGTYRTLVAAARAAGPMLMTALGAIPDELAHTAPVSPEPLPRARAWQGTARQHRLAYRTRRCS